jgi:hypothetical protein
MNYREWTAVALEKLLKLDDSFFIDQDQLKLDENH